MQRKKNSVLSLVFVIILLTVMISPRVSFAQGNGEVKVVFNGQKLDFDVKPMIINGRTMVPFRKIGESMGVVVGWNERDRTIHGRKGSIYVKLQLDNDTALVNGREIKLDVPATLKQNRTLVPLRFFSEVFGANVYWDQNTFTVTITTGPVPKHILGYYYSKSFGDFQRSLGNLSSAAFKWYTLDSSGNLISTDVSRSIFVPEGYEEALKLARENGIHTYALIFESSSERLHNILSDSVKRKALIQQIIKLTEDEGYDGVNIDFEFLREGDREYLNSFMKELHDEMSDKSKILSISLHAKTEKVDWFKGYDYETLGKYSDFVVLMAYDKSPSMPGPQAPIQWVEEVVDYTVKRIPADKVMLGIGVYGYGWTEAGSRTTWLLTRNEVDYRIRFIDEAIEEYNIEPSWNETAQMPYFSFTDSEGVKHTVWYENESSIWAKLDLVRRKNLKGIAFWRLGYTTPGVWNVVNQLFRAIKYY
ncbi:MAG: copper amine oxidase [Firmicutes bacterium]|nr:copper amine oxidase [Bacillota bacterium]